MNGDIKEVIIIGAGPAGVACALQLERYNIKPLVLEGDKIGGLLRNANLVENYPGFPTGISGFDLVELLVKQLQTGGIEVRFEEVLNLTYNDDLFTVETEIGTHEAETIVIASGTRPRRPSEFKIPDKIEDRVFYEVDPIRDIEGERVAIIGAGDAGFDYALTLSRSNELVIFNRSEKPRCNAVLWERTQGEESIEYLSEVVIREVKGRGIIEFMKDVVGMGDESRVRIEYERVKDGDSITEKFDYLLIAIGREPQLNFLSDEMSGRLDELTEEKKLFLIGDVKNDIYRQTAIAFGDGVRAGMEIGETKKDII